MTELKESSDRGFQIVMLASAAACAIAKNLTADEENVLGNFITLIGTALSTIAAVDETAEGNSDSSNTDKS